MSSTDPYSGPTPQDLAVIICAYTDERWDETLAALHSVVNQSHPVGEIVLVVDHSPALLQRFADFVSSDDSGLNGVQVVANSHKSGLSGARNSGIEATSLPIIAFLDDDASAEPDWALRLSEAYTTPEVAGAGGYIEPNWKSARPTWWPREFDWVVGCSYVGLPQQRAAIRNPIGANMSVRRLAFETVGGFSPAIGRVGKHPVGCEETELFIRIARQQPSAVAIYEPDARVIHNVAPERANFNYFRRRCYAEGISKAVVSQLSKGAPALGSEWTYTLKVLPTATFNALASQAKGDKAGAKRAAAIVGGLAFTTAGYIRGRLSKGPKPSIAGVPKAAEA